MTRESPLARRHQQMRLRKNAHATLARPIPIAGGTFYAVAPTEAPPFEFTGTCEICGELIAGNPGAKQHKQCERIPDTERPPAPPATETRAHQFTLPGVVL